MFRNLTFFRFAQPTGVNLSAVHDLLVEAALKPVGPFELSSRGWVPPFGTGGELFHQVGECVVLTLGGEDRLLPASVVNAEMLKRIAKVEEAEGRKLGGRARKRLREDLVMELLPRALVKPSRLTGYLDLARGLLVVDTASRKAAEGFVSELRNTLGSFPALPVNAEVSPRAALTDWLQGNGLDDSRLVDARFALGEEVELRDPVDGGAVAKLKDQELQSEEVRVHLECGKLVHQMGLSLNDRVAFTFGEDLVVRKFQLLDLVLEQHQGEDHGSIEAELDARYTILTAEVGALFDRLAEAFRFSPVEA
jgi:recombination associated protein RdgC